MFLRAPRTARRPDHPNAEQIHVGRRPSPEPADGTGPGRRPDARGRGRPRPSRSRSSGPGIDLHDKGQFDQAIAKYQEVLARSPSNATALFEMAYSYLAKKDYDKSFETARRGSEFKSELLPMFYDVMASSLDGQGQPQQAVEIVQEGDCAGPRRVAALLQHGGHVPREPQQARRCAARVAEGRFDRTDAPGRATAARPGVPVERLYDTGVSRAVDVPGARPRREPGTARVRTVARAAERRCRSDSRRRSGRPRHARGHTDEGREDRRRRFRRAARHSSRPRTTAFMRKLDAGTPEIQALVAQVDQLLGALPTQPAGPAATSFVNTHYVPFFVALKQKNFVEPFVYWASQRAPVPGVDGLAPGERAARCASSSTGLRSIPGRSPEPLRGRARSN